MTPKVDPRRGFITSSLIVVLTAGGLFCDATFLPANAATAPNIATTPAKLASADESTSTHISDNNILISDNNILTLDSVLDKAIDKSYDLKLADADTKIAKSGIKEARAALYPQLSGQINSDYQRNLAGLQGQQVNVVGNSILPAGTRFQNALIGNLNWTIFDFGARAKQVASARNTYKASQIAKMIQLRDLKLKIVELYTEISIAYQSLRAKESMLKLYQDVFVMKKMMFESGHISKVEYADHSIKLANTVSEIQELKTALSNHLQSLSFHTQENYDIDTIAVAPIADEGYNPQYDITPDMVPDFQRLQLLITAKKAELSAIKRQRLPQISLYSSMVFFGNDPTNPMKAIDNISQRSFYSGFVVNIPFFDGFKTQSQIDKAKAELERLTLQQQQTMWQIRNKYQTSVTGVVLMKSEKDKKDALVGESKDKEVMVSRLSQQQLVEKTQLKSEQAAVIEKNLESSKADIQRIAHLKKLQIMAGVM